MRDKKECIWFFSDYPNTAKYTDSHIHSTHTQQINTRNTMERVNCVREACEKCMCVVQYLAGRQITTKYYFV